MTGVTGRWVFCERRGRAIRGGECPDRSRSRLDVLRSIGYNSCTVVQVMSDSCSHGSPPDRVGPSIEVIEQAARFFRALGDPARLRVIAELAGRELCVSELAALSGDSLSAVSQRLRVLRADGLVTRRRDGKHLHYSLSDGHVSALVANAIEHASEEHTEDSSPSDDEE